MANICDLPVELWFLIAQYLPKEQLFELKSVNSFFLNHWIDFRWREIQISMGVPCQLDRSVRLLHKMAYVHKKGVFELILISFQ